MTDGHVWTWRERLAWLGLRVSMDNATKVAHAAANARGKPKRIKDRDWPTYPWEEPASAPVRYGDTGGRDGVEVISFLDSFG